LFLEKINSVLLLTECSSDEHSIPSKHRFIILDSPKPFALILDGVVQQIMKTNVATASLLLEGPQIVRCKDDAIAGQTAEEVAL
jgi:hypothetical protein